MTDSLYKPQEEKVSTEADSGLFDKSRKKSSRSKADLFEILIAIKLREKFKLKKEDLEVELIKIKKHINKNSYKDEDVRIKEQTERAEITSSFLAKKVVEISIKNGQPIKIDWVGRKWQDEGSVSDIDITFKNGYMMGFSIKSTRNGFGTQRNIGKATSIIYLNLDIDKELKQMTFQLRKELYKQNNIKLKKLSSASLSAIKEGKYKFSIIGKFGKELGGKVQNKAVNQSVEQFNVLSSQKKQKFINYLFGLESKPIMNVICVGKAIYFCENIVFDNLMRSDFLAIKSGNKGFNISSDGKILLRIQVCFTNGIGLSAFCERAFLTKETKKYFKKVIL
jgi:hypothetical protein